MLDESLLQIRQSVFKSDLDFFDKLLDPHQIVGVGLVISEGNFFLAVRLATEANEAGL
jgi:hypothetical protein